MDKQAFFKNAKSFRDWLEQNHHQETVLWVCYYKKHTKLASLTWDESVAEALCYGWIDGLRKSIDEESYRIRFTPRRKNSIWSRKNIDTVESLLKQDRMMPAGLQAFEYRKESKSAIYTYEKPKLKLSKEYCEVLKSKKTVWANYNILTPSVKKMSINWIMAAKKQETRDRRFAIFIESCGANEVVPPLRWTKNKK
jgi:uncharacterized protein YdeI (YjbR/CyaY-like superfamily)